MIGVDRYGYPYLVWVDGRNQNTDIYYAGSTFVHSNTLASQNVSPASDAIIGTEPANITGVDDDIQARIPGQDGAGRLRASGTGHRRLSQVSRCGGEGTSEADSGF